MATVYQTYKDFINTKPVAVRNPTQNGLAGSCQEMCPKYECQFRSRNHLIHPMETATPFTPMKRSERKPVLEKMVKEYSRPAADKKVRLADVRTFDVLIETSEYLLSLVDSYQLQNQWAIVYEFVSDRFRAIRQDFIVQQLQQQQIIRLLELQIPFYLNARKRCEDAKAQNYDKKLHNSEMDECFSRWYEAVRGGGEASTIIMQAYCYYYLKKENVVYDIFEVMGFNEDAIQLKNVVFCYIEKNYARFFQILKNLEVDYVRNALLVHAGEMRLEALTTFRIAFGAKGVTFPIDALSNILGFPSVKLLEDCLKRLFHFSSNGIPIPFTFYGISQQSLEASQLTHHWFVL